MSEITLEPGVYATAEPQSFDDARVQRKLVAPAKCSPYVPDQLDGSFVGPLIPFFFLSKSVVSETEKGDGSATFADTVVLMGGRSR